MREWLIRHQKIVSRSVGILLILGAAVSLFWDMRGGGVSEEERLAAERVAQYEARMHAQMAGSQKKSAEKPYFMEAYKEKQEQQLRYAVVIALTIGIGFVGYSFLRKEER